jgi:uncharacterized membrane protein
LRKVLRFYGALSRQATRGRTGSARDSERERSEQRPSDTPPSTLHEARKGAKWGAVGGAVVGLIFPPALLASAAVGAGVGAGIGGLVSHGQKNEIKADVEDVLPLNSSAVVAVFEEQWEEDIDSALSNAKNITKEKVDRDSADQVKAAADET